MHTLEKIDQDGKNWYCCNCCQSWKSKPKSYCPGVPVRDWGDPIPESEINSIQIKKERLRLKEGTEPIAVRGCRSGRVWDWIYKRSDVFWNPIYNPEVITWDDKKNGDHLTIFEMNKKLVRPRMDAPAYHLPLWDKESESWYYILAIKESDCEPCDSQNYISQGIAKKEYKLDPVKLGIPFVESKLNQYRKTIYYFDRRVIETYSDLKHTP